MDRPCPSRCRFSSRAFHRNILFFLCLPLNLCFVFGLFVVLSWIYVKFFYPELYEYVPLSSGDIQQTEEELGATTQQSAFNDSETNKAERQEGRTTLVNTPFLFPWKQSWSAQIPLYYSGLHNTLSALFLTYASDPAKTPVELQSIISSMVILPSFCMTKWYLKKNVTYNLSYLMASVCFLVGGMLLAVIPVLKSNDDQESQTSMWLWIVVYILGTIFRAAANIQQEKYFLTTREFSTPNKIWVVFVSRLVQFVLVSLLFWMDPVMKKQSLVTSWTQFDESWQNGFESKEYGWLFQLFIFSYLVLFFASLSLNAISTNFNMVASMIITPCTMLFFQIFDKFNPGLKFSWGITLGSLTCNVLSTLLWIAAEKLPK